MTGWLWTAMAFAGARDVPSRPVDCPSSPLAAVTNRAAEVETAFDESDVVAFDGAAEELARIIGCVDEPIDSDVAIQIHYAMGLRAFASRDSAAAARSLRAIRLLDPAWRPSPDWMQDGQPLYALYREELPHHEVPVAGRVPGELRVDGRTTNLVPENESYVLQVVDRRNTAIYTGYHLSVTTLPDLGPENSTRRIVRTVGSSVGGLLLAGAVVSEVAASDARTALRDPSTPTEDLAGLYSRSNTLDTVALGIGVGTAAVVGVTWVVPW